MMKTTAARLALLRAAYLVTFDVFATDRTEIATDLQVSKATATSLLQQLAAMRLVDSIDVNDEAQGSGRRGQYQELTWQCNTTYDSINRAEAGALFDSAVAEHLIVNPSKKESTMKARRSTKTAKVTAQSQGFPAVYLGPNGNFKPGLDARAKSDLRAAVAGKRTGKELHRFTKATATKLLKARGW